MKNEKDFNVDIKEEIDEYNRKLYSQEGYKDKSDESLIAGSCAILFIILIAIAYIVSLFG